ncbi:hypothetical protein T552_03704 [Pneumocystis carinii B80]|uniref:Major surface glycoprotein 2 C-terminal domain-containing protein n=1 Tax=Pneumocystis carinii (strain B80) TaxID=1408658 RepID=A0A0W4ZAY0_PNEC8|nr:hypothetical protein T552_03704 [Pneumocystis carinii B80]KTW25542.1 hypothetical protein T552_03704 [Pneumocystis carinii B80]
MARPVKRQAAGVVADEIKQEHLLAFIVKEKYKDNKCKEELEKYCEELKKADEKLENVDKKVKGLCDEKDKKKKCEELKDDVEQELENFDAELPDKLGKLKDEECEKYEEKCILLEEADDGDVKKNCVKLREGCYKLKREKVAEELLFRALGKDVKNGECEKKMKDVCPMLSRESDELMAFCLDPSGTCGELSKKLGTVCQPLQKELNKNELEEKCHERLEKCHFYGEACGNTKCKDDKEECKKNNITYKAPGSDFTPVKPRASLLTMIGLEDVYKRAEKDGILIGRQGVDLPKTFGDNLLQDLLLVLSQDENDKKPEKKCEKALGKCDASKHLDDDLKKLCEDGDKQKKCQELLNVEERCTNLKLNLHLKDLSTKFEKDKDSEPLFWRQLPTLFTKGECAELVSECFYLEKACKDNKIDQACQNVRAACYKMGQNRMLNRLFREGLKENPDNIKYYDENPQKCQKFVLESCTKLKKYLPQCLYPKELCYAVSDDIFLQSKELGVLLDDQRDFPLEKDCLELKEKCAQLETYSNSNSQKCATLRRRCKYLRVSEGFRNVFLKREDDSLKKENCTKALQEKCDALSRKRRNPFGFSCALREETCEYMVARTKDECFYLKDNMVNEKILKEIEEKAKKANGNETLVEELCTTWGRHCHQLVKNCPDDLKKNKNNQGYNCDELEEKCSETFKKLKSKEELTHLLKGSLSNNKCKEALGKRCTELQNNETFKILLDKCDDNTKEKVCKELVEKLKKRCPTLKTDLEKAKEELEKNKNDYDALKKAAEESTKAASLLLSRPRQIVMPNAQNGSASEEVSQPPSAPEKESSPPQVPAGSSSSDSSSQSQGSPSSSTGGTPNASDGTPNKSAGTTGPAKLGLVKRAYVEGGVSEVEVKAFDETTIAMELYLELKEECKALELDCGFKEDCPESKSACEEIEKLCKLEALKVAPHHTETITNKVTETQTETQTVEKVDDKTNVKTVEKTVTVTKPGSGEKVTEECTMIQTTDTWVTSTSLHTSTTTSTSTVTSTVTLTSMRKCKPTKCTTDSTKETQKGEEEEVKPNDGVKIRVPDMIKIMLLGVIVMGMM